MINSTIWICAESTCRWWLYLISWMVREIGSPMRLSRPNDSLTNSLFCAGHDNRYWQQCNTTCGSELLRQHTPLLGRSSSILWASGMALPINCGGISMIHLQTTFLSQPQWQAMTWITNLLNMLWLPWCTIMWQPLPFHQLHCTCHSSPLTGTLWYQWWSHPPGPHRSLWCIMSR